MADTTLFVSSAHAAQLPVTGDASVDSGRPAANLGSLSNLYVGNGNTSLLQFSLSSRPSGDLIELQYSQTNISGHVDYTTPLVYQ